MVAAPSFTPQAWQQLGGYTRLIVLHQADHDTARRQVIATHLATIAPYASGGRADSIAEPLVAQHYADEDARRAGRQTPGEQREAATAAVPDPLAEIEQEALQRARELVAGYQARSRAETGSATSQNT